MSDSSRATIPSPEPQGFDAVYRAHKDAVHAYACCLVGAGAAAEDLVHDAFMGLLRRLGDVDIDRDPRPWLLRSVRHRAFDMSRRRQARSRGEPLADEAEATDAAGLGSMATEERSAVIRQALEALGPAHADVVRLHVYGRLGYEAIGEVLGIPAATARTRYRTATERLRVSLMGVRHDG